MVHALAWAIYYIFLQGNSHDLHLKIGIQFHASFVSFRRGKRKLLCLWELEAESSIMKKGLLFLAFMAIINLGHAQDPLSYECVIQKEGISAEQIFNQLVDWIATNFKAVDGDFYRDKEEKVITKDVMIDFTTGKLTMSCYDGSLRYKLKFQCRDGRFKVQMTNFEHDVKAGNSTSCILGLILDQPVRKGNGIFDEKAWNKIKETTDAEAARIQRTLESLNFNTENDDW